MRRRDTAIAAAGGQRWNPTDSGQAWNTNVVNAGHLCYHQRINTPVTVTRHPSYLDEDIFGTSYYAVVPSVNRGFPSVGGATGGTCSGTARGIIYVEGDVIVEGIVDGKVTVAAAGNIWLSHEVQYEENPNRPMRDYGNPDDIDMLGLFATGSVIVPNHYPQDSYASADRPLRLLDDWSDAPATYSGFVGSGRFDHPPMGGDDGNEEIHAVIVSFGFGPCTFTGGTPPASIRPTTRCKRRFKTSRRDFTRCHGRAMGIRGPVRRPYPARCPIRRSTIRAR
ncbi:MAG: hypothetical protein M5R36_12590 [Deltaproteobacteria bacterium]|nr:hypothetical protein [Deltaproteobacteria bacterium]